MRAITCAVMVLAASIQPASIPPAQAQQAKTVEGPAVWKTWVIASSQQYRVPPPPDRAAYWDTGAPSYRWSEIAVAEHLKNGSNWLVAARNLALMHVAIHDAMVAAWDSKYAYQRPRPSEVKTGLTTVVAN